MGLISELTKIALKEAVGMTREIAAWEIAAWAKNKKSNPQQSERKKQVTGPRPG